MTAIRVTRSVTIPDLVRISRYKRVPELGPRLLFFSGGTAFNATSRVLKHFTYNSTHLISPFDSGGSSAVLRKAFEMPSIGDLRSRLMALADESVTGHPEVFNLFAYRFPKTASAADLLAQLEQMIAGKDPLLREIPNPMRRLIRNQLGYFRANMQDNFDLRGASIGNLILTGGYLNNHKHLDPIIFLFSKLVGVRGTVRAVINDNLHLVAELEDGSTVIGQHLITGKEVAPLTSPIRRIFLSSSRDKLRPVTIGLRKKTRKLIRQAELVCYSPGSFYTSLLANLLPEGVGRAIASLECPKVWIPNLGADPEQIGMDLEQSLARLLEYLRADAGQEQPAERLVNFVLIDSQRGIYPSRLAPGLVEELGIQLIDTRLVRDPAERRYDPELLASALLSLV